MYTTLQKHENLKRQILKKLKKMETKNFWAIFFNNVVYLYDNQRMGGL